MLRQSGVIDAYLLARIVEHAPVSEIIHDRADYWAARTN